MSAGVIAAEVGFGLHRIDLSGVVSKYVGETKKISRARLRGSRLLPTMAQTESPLIPAVSSSR